MFRTLTALTLWLLSSLAIAAEPPLASHWSYLDSGWHPAAQVAWINEGHAVEPWVGLSINADQWVEYQVGLDEINRRGLPLRVRISQPEKNVPVAGWKDPAAWRETGAVLARSAEWRRLYALTPDVEYVAIVSNNEYSPTEDLTDAEVVTLFGALIEGFESEVPAWQGKIRWGAWNALPYKDSSAVDAPARAYPWDRISLRWGYDARIGRTPDPFMQVNFWRGLVNERGLAEVELAAWDGSPLYHADPFTVDQWLGMCRYGLWTMQDGVADRRVVIAPWLGWSTPYGGVAEAQWESTLAAVDEVQTSATLARFWSDGEVVPVTVQTGWPRVYGHARRIGDEWLFFAVAPKGAQSVKVTAAGVDAQTIQTDEAGTWRYLDLRPEPTPTPTPEHEPVLIDLNNASADELMTLPNIGPVRAHAIIEARPFASVDDLTRVSGIGAATLAGVRGLVTVGAFERPWAEYEFQMIDENTIRLREKR